MKMKTFDKRTPGLFKVEKRCDKMIALCPKMYICDYQFPTNEQKPKFSAKGISVNEKTNINYERFNDVLTGNLIKHEVVNKGFRVINNEVVTCEQKKVGLSIIYDKRVVLADGVSTIPLDI